MDERCPVAQGHDPSFNLKPATGWTNFGGSGRRRIRPSSTAPSPSEAIRRSMASMIMLLVSVSIVPGGRYNASEACGGVPVMAASSCSADAMVSNPSGPGISGGMGGAPGGTGGRGGDAGAVAQPGTATSDAAQVAAQSSDITAVLGTAGTNGMGQPTALATSLKPDTVVSHTTAIPPKSGAATNI
eukprot:856785-Prymnesium_polylepis.1